MKIDHIQILTMVHCGQLQCKVHVVSKETDLLNRNSCWEEKNPENKSDFILFFTDMLRGGLHLRKTLLQQEPGLQECSE